MKKILSLGLLLTAALGSGELMVACSSSSSTANGTDDGGPGASSDSGQTSDSAIFTGDSSTAIDSGATADGGGTPIVDAGPKPLINGCTSFTDNTASGVASLNWGFGISGDVNHCSKILVGQSVTWTGDFGTHPLGPHDDTQPGGTATNGDPITSGASPGSSVTITFPTAGTYGYWCMVHQTMMMGAIEVQ